jgi:hypothetical protein
MMGMYLISAGAEGPPLKFKEFRETVASVEPMLIAPMFHLLDGGAAGNVNAQADAQFITISLSLSSRVAV